VFRHPAVNHLAPLMREHDKDKQDPDVAVGAAISIRVVEVRAD